MNSNNNCFSSWDADDFHVEINEQATALKDAKITDEELLSMVDTSKALYPHAPTSLKPRIADHIHLCNLRIDYR